MDEKPKALEFAAWIAAFPRLKGRTELIIWWAVIKRIWIPLLLSTLLANLLWLLFLKFFSAQLHHHGFYWWAWALGF